MDPDDIANAADTTSVADSADGVSGDPELSARSRRRAWAIGVWAVVALVTVAWVLPRERVAPDSDAPGGQHGEPAGARAQPTESRAVLAESSVSVSALANRGFSAMGQRATDPTALERALALFTQGYEQDPEHVDARFGLAWARQVEGRPESEWRPLYDSIVADSSEILYFSLTNLAVAEREAGRRAEERVFLERAVRVRPDRVDGWIQLGSSHEANGDHALAADVYQRASQVDVGSARAYYQLGRANHRLGRTSAAEAAWTRALELDPGLGGAIAADRTGGGPGGGG